MCLCTRDNFISHLCHLLPPSSRPVDTPCQRKNVCPCTQMHSLCQQFDQLRRRQLSKLTIRPQSGHRYHRASQCWKHRHLCRVSTSDISPALFSHFCPPGRIRCVHHWSDTRMISSSAVRHRPSRITQLLHLDAAASHEGIVRICDCLLLVVPICRPVSRVQHNKHADKTREK